ncbi:MAG: winged helix-turn-helix domain-containing protein [Candidatus Eremiobacteraeota bacterium]|nr:winged helix-turn-helix domain-containing protein [Candidatus Eremiobacteraeota bacterium]
MTENADSAEKNKKAAGDLKKARQAWGPPLKELIERRKTNDEIQKAIVKALEEEAATVPQLAEKTGIEPGLVFWHINALRKYNVLTEEKRRGDYTFYRKK